MTNKLGKHDRKSIRLKGYDYSHPGAYFITLVTHQRQMFFGDVVNGEVQLNRMGLLVSEIWRWMPEQFEFMELGEYIFMPNHFHAIVWINDRPVGYNNQGQEPSRYLRKESLGTIVGQFKSRSAKKIKAKYPSFYRLNSIIWQRNYYEHIIRDEDDLRKVTDYIIQNPIQWEDDSENPLKR